MNDEQLPTKTTNSWEETARLVTQMEDDKETDRTEIERLRQTVLATPDFLAFHCSTTNSIRQQLVEKMSYGGTRACMLAEGDMLAKQLGYDDAPPLERLLIDHILTVRLRLIYAEHNYNHRVVNQPATIKVAEYWDNLLALTQARFLRAVETLARVRRLARNTSALQINIARDGGQQVNIQGSTSENRG